MVFPIALARSVPAIRPVHQPNDAPDRVPGGAEAGQVVRRAFRDVTHSAVVVDFDDTLYLGCSTREYLESVQPRLLARILLTGVRALFRLTRSTRGARFVYEDWLAVLVVTVLTPWTLPRWRRSAAARAGARRNTELVDALADVGTMHVVTFGFRPIVGPLLKDVHPTARLLIASDLWRGYRLRAEGKRVAVERCLGAQVLADAVVITDSRADGDLLAACRTPLLLLWSKD